MIYADQLLDAYAELEQDIREKMATLFSNSCGLCTLCCCRADICEEATESAFLAKLLKRQGLSVEDLDDRLGWLDLHGCSLQYGKPPVCYAYFCDELLHELPDDTARRIIQTFGLLMHHVGYRPGKLHLTEIRSDEELNALDCSDAMERLQQSRSTFAVIEQWMEDGSLSATDQQTLDRITADPP